MSLGLRVGFIGLGVMGEPMCRHIAQKRAGELVTAVTAYDLAPEPLKRLEEHGVSPVADATEVVARSDLIMLSLPGDSELRSLCQGKGGLLDSVGPGQSVVDLGTTSVALSRELRDAFAASGADYADAPVARTRAAAENGSLLVLVGAEKLVFKRVRPVLSCFAEEVLHCGDVGAGQVVKQMNNMVLFQTVNALAEALAVSREAGVDGETLFEAFKLGSADSFALRSHGMKALLPGVFPERAFPASYALKDLSYAIGLAEQGGISTGGALAVRAALESAIDAGFADEYFPAIIKTLKAF